TTHAVYGEAMGILCGDALLNYAFEVALTSLEKANGNYERIGKALSLLASKAGVYGMIGGQVVDVESEKSLEVSKEKLDFIYEYKTGALIEASMMIGAILSKATDEDIELIGKVASKVGLAFQIQDDILDIEGNEATLGKPIGSDIKNNKATYVSFAGLDKSKAEVKRLTEEAIDLLDSLPYDNPFLKELLLYLIYRQN
ncbi:MAG: polyprenyl synthetase family protein, partial [Pseudobutyrivibrio sp.]|nr:polyprenyl synthetase family protein [Pseudobutyrivibrio sp.]